MKTAAVTPSSAINSALLGDHAKNELSTADLLVFTGLESLGSLAVFGNLCLIIVLLRFKYLGRASFILMLNLAIADVLHGLVTTVYFYPPIALKSHHLSIFVMRIFNVIDWTAWAITLTHMSAICLDKLTAVMLYGRYSMTVTVNRIRAFSVSCWVVFTTTNIVFFLFDVCCMILPLKDHDYYSFGYHHNDTEFRGSGILNYTNVYVYTYTPVEIVTIIVLSVSNPITLVQLYRRRKRKQALRQQPSNSIAKNGIPAVMKARSQWQRASAMLIAMSMKMGNRNLNSDVRELAARRANRQHQRIMMQISVVAVIFFSYMSAYYLSYYVFAISSKWAMAFHSFFYSTTHMINPVIYFTCNAEMRSQLKETVHSFWLYSTCRSKKHANELAYSCSKSTHTEKRSQAKYWSRPECSDSWKSLDVVSSDRAFGSSQPTKSFVTEDSINGDETLAIPNNRISSAIATETSPLFSSNSHYKSTAVRRLSDRMSGTMASLDHSVNTMNPVQSYPSLTARKESGLRFDGKKSKVTIDVINEGVNYLDDVSGYSIRKQPSNKRKNGDNHDTVINSNNFRPRSYLFSAKQTVKQRPSLLDRLIASLTTNESDSTSEDSSSDDDIFISSSSSSPIMLTKPPKQSYSVEFTSSADHNRMRVSSTMDALPSALRSVSRKAFGMSDRTSKHNSDDDNFPLLHVFLSDDDNGTENPVPQPNLYASTLDDPSAAADVLEEVPTEAVSIRRTSNRILQNGEPRRFKSVCCSEGDSRHSSVTVTGSPNVTILSEGSLDDVVFL